MSRPPIWPDNFDRLVDHLRETQTPKRFRHILGVLHAVLGLADCHGLDREAAAYAALLHDICKIGKKADQRRPADETGERIPPEDEEFPGLWHAWSAAGVARRDWGIEEQEILDAIRHHSTGHAEMAPLAKILFLADFLEPMRGQPERWHTLMLARRDLDGALIRVLREKCGHIEGSRGKVHPRALRALQTLEEDLPRAQEA